MGSSGITGATTPTIVPTPTSNTNASGSSSTGSASNSTKTLADNFQAFLSLLTTQLQNQNPLDPLDTNQFTQQLVQFAQVEQQLKSNDQLTALVNLQKSAESTQALGFVGTTVAVDGTTTQLKNSLAAWNFTTSKPASATVTITDKSGQTVYSKTYTVQAGRQEFVWDGKDKNGQQLQDGTYKLSVAAKDASGQTVGVSTEIEGVVDSVDFTQTPPLLSIGGDSYTLDKIKRVTRPVT